jgi:acyl-coenzyme A thioesterase PaaI-like protein
MEFNIADLPLATTLGIELASAEKTRIVGRLAVREEITTGGHILHGGAFMSLADTLGAIGAVLNLPDGARHDAGKQDQLPRQRPRRRDHHRRGDAAARRSTLQRLADTDH